MPGRPPAEYEYVASDDTDVVLCDKPMHTLAAGEQSIHALELMSDRTFLIDRTEPDRTTAPVLSGQQHVSIASDPWKRSRRWPLTSPSRPAA